MSKKISADTVQALVVAIAERYKAAARPEKQRILDEFVAVLGYHRKHAIRMFNSGEVPRKPRCRRRSESEPRAALKLSHPLDCPYHELSPAVIARSA